MTSSVTTLTVQLDFGTKVYQVGKIEEDQNQLHFSYDEQYLSSGLEISPLHLPRRAGVVPFDRTPFEGLAGVFDDSLPDGWGRLLYDRWLASQGKSSSVRTVLNRLARIGKSGLGALTYEEKISRSKSYHPFTLDEIANESRQILEDHPSEMLEALLNLNGPLAGARPKIVANIAWDLSSISYSSGCVDDDSYEPWIIKFPSRSDSRDAGAIEYVYALMAKEAGLEMERVHLFESAREPGFFATRRFDRDTERRYHVHTACGLLHADFRTPALDYRDLLALTYYLTQDIREVEKMYRMAVFNVFAHNRDDHGKNFSFLMDESGRWRVSPAYDLTFSYGPGGEQSTMVLGEGRNPSSQQLIELGLQAKIARSTIDDILDQTTTALSCWPRLASEWGVFSKHINHISPFICR